MTGGNDVPPVDQHAAAFALAYADQGLPGERAEAGRLAVKHAPVGVGRATADRVIDYWTVFNWELKCKQIIY